MPDAHRCRANHLGNLRGYLPKQVQLTAPVRSPIRLGLILVLAKSSDRRNQAAESARASRQFAAEFPAYDPQLVETEVRRKHLPAPIDKVMRFVDQKCGRACLPVKVAPQIN